jgi:hypothetical protein
MALEGYTISLAVRSSATEHQLRNEVTMYYNNAMVHTALSLLPHTHTALTQRTVAAVMATASAITVVECTVSCCS